MVKPRYVRKPQRTQNNEAKTKNGEFQNFFQKKWKIFEISKAIYFRIKNNPNLEL